MLRKEDRKLKEDIIDRLDETFEKIYNEYNKLIMYFALSKTSNRNDAEDLVQEIFMKVYAKIHEYNPEISSFKTWLVRIANNHIIDFLKCKKENVVYDNEFINTISDNIVINDKFDFVTRNLRTLEKDVLVLKIVYNFSHKEISETLNITLDVSKKLYKSAKSKVKEEWKNYEM